MFLVNVLFCVCCEHIIRSCDIPSLRATVVVSVFIMFTSHMPGTVLYLHNQSDRTSGSEVPSWSTDRVLI